MGLFNKYEMEQYHRTLEINFSSALKRLTESGFVRVFAEAAHGRPTVYALTNKAKNLCKDMHLYTTGEKMIPIKGEKNALDEKDARINRYFLRSVEDMRKDLKGE